MRITIAFILAAVFAGTAWAAQTPGEGGKDMSSPKDLAAELEDLASQAAQGARRQDEPIAKLKETIQKRGFVEEKLLEAQDKLIQSIDSEKAQAGAPRLAFLAIHAALLTKWHITSPTDAGPIEEHYFPIIRNRKFSRYLRAHYLKRAEDARRDYRGEKTASVNQFHKALLALAKELEADASETPELRAEAFGIIEVADLNQAERRRLLLKHCRSKNELLRKTAIYHGSFPHNLSEEILDEILTQYETDQSDAIQRESRFALSRVARFAKTEAQQNFKEKAIKRLELMKEKNPDPERRKRIKELLNEMEKLPK